MAKTHRTRYGRDVIRLTLRIPVELADLAKQCAYELNIPLQAFIIEGLAQRVKRWESAIKKEIVKKPDPAAAFWCGVENDVATKCKHQESHEKQGFWHDGRGIRNHPLFSQEWRDAEDKRRENEREKRSE